MALTPVEEVRTGIGDFTTPYILTNDQIQHYLDSNDSDVDLTIDELQPIIFSALASRGVLIKAEDLTEDNRQQAQNYEAALRRIDQAKASKAVPIIGGSSTTPISLSIDQFDPEVQE